MYALVVYTGNDTKQVLNQGQYKFKISSLAYQLNIILFINLAIMIIQMLFMSQIATRVWLYNNLDKHWYIFPDKKIYDKELTIFETLMSFYLLFNQLIPMDLAINLILNKMFYTILIEADVQMIDL